MLQDSSIQSLLRGSITLAPLYHPKKQKQEKIIVKFGIIESRERGRRLVYQLAPFFLS